MVKYEIRFTKAAAKDIKLLKQKGLWDKTKDLIGIIRENPYATPPSYEKLYWDVEGAYSRRINIQHRLVYQVYKKEKVIKIISMWGHYE